MVSIQSLIRRVPTEVFAEINSMPGTTVRSIQRPQHHQLYCRTGYHLIITPHGAVRGTRDQYNSYSKFLIITLSTSGRTRLQIDVKKQVSNLFIKIFRYHGVYNSGSSCGCNKECTHRSLPDDFTKRRSYWLGKLL